jgi:hypothetical protein
LPERIQSLLNPARLVAFRQAHEPAVSYTDELLRQDSITFQGFLHRLATLGLKGACGSPLGRVTPFFGKTKNNKHRFILDCRKINQMFRKPFKPKMASAKNLQRLSVEKGGGPVYEAECDLANCFFQIAAEAFMQDSFCFEIELPGSWYIELGISHTHHGEPIVPNTMYLPCFCVLPMGFSWSMWIVQEMVAHLICEAGVEKTQVLVGNWPCPKFANGVIADPYCHNLNFFGLDKDAVNQTLQQVMKVFSEKGFSLHEISWASTTATPLGCQFDGQGHSVGPKSTKLETLIGACKHMVPDRVVSGHTVEVLLGVFYT